MFSSHLRSTLLPLSLVVCIGAFAARGVLKADGVIRVKGTDLHNAQVTVVPGHAVAYSLPVGSKHLTLDLPLDDVYLVSVQQMGCPTKEVYFDTRVPVDMHAMVFKFPFQVTLESLPADRMFAYDGPVGFVRYVHALKDFGYETNYTVRVEEDLKLRMKEIQQTGVDPKIIAPPIQARVIDRPRGGYSAAVGTFADAAPSTTAPMVNEVPRLVHVVSGPATPEESSATADVDPVAGPPLEGMVVGPVALPLAEPVAIPATPIRAATVEDSQEALPLPTLPIPPPEVGIQGLPTNIPALRGDSSRTEELITEHHRITRVIRFTAPAGNVEEFRKVSHAFGAVYYFQGDRSITERDFAHAIAE